MKKLIIIVFFLLALSIQAQNTQPTEVAFWNIIALGVDKDHLPKPDVRVCANLSCYNNSLIFSVVAIDYKEVIIPDIIINDFSFDPSSAYNNKYIGYSGIGCFFDNPSQKFKITINLSQYDYGRDIIILHLYDGKYYIVGNLISEKMSKNITTVGMYGIGPKPKETLQQYLINSFKKK